MEFEKDAAITDEQRVLAATRNATIEPLSASIVRDEEVGPPTIVERQANVESDSENTSVQHTLLQPSQGELTPQHQPRSRHHFGVALILSALVAGVMGGATLFIALG